MKASESTFRNCLYFTANALARKVEKMAIESWKSVGLSPSHGYLLMLVNKEPGLQPGCIADNLQLTPSTVTRLIEKLEAMKLVVRTSGGKATNVYPTPVGKKLLPQLKQCVDDFNRSYSNFIGKEECSRMVENMHKLADKMT
ncbi:MAG: MarR family winged helix-turn-helix transcriptional regulator [Chitinophagaceae bacterium]